MNYSLMRFLDEYVGVPICLLIGVYEHTINKIFSKQKTGEIKKILFIRFWGIGSIILSSPAIKELRKKYPNAKIILLTMLINKGVYERHELFDEIVYYEFKDLYDIFLYFLKLIIRLRKEKIDMVIDLEHFSKFSTIISYFTGARESIGFYLKGRHRDLPYSITVPFQDNQHTIYNFLNLIKHLGINTKNNKLVKLNTSKETKDYIDNLLFENKINKKNILIGMNINSSDYAIARRWSKEKFAKLADMIIEKYHAKIVFIGAKFDKNYVDSTLNLMKNKAINLAGKTDIEGLAELLSKFDLFISNDSGPLHIATAMNIPTISFFGPETPKLYGPIGKKHIVFYKNLPCSPCITVYNNKKAECNYLGPECIKIIKEDEVMKAVDKQLKSIISIKRPI